MMSVKGFFEVNKKGLLIPLPYLCWLYLKRKSSLHNYFNKSLLHQHLTVKSQSQIHRLFWTLVSPYKFLCITYYYFCCCSYCVTYTSVKYKCVTIASNNSMRKYRAIHASFEKCEWASRWISSYKLAGYKISDKIGKTWYYVKPKS